VTRTATRIVIDASTAVALVIGRHPRADRALAVLDEADTVLAPRLYWTEVAHALWKYSRLGLHESDAIRCLEEAGALVEEPVDDELLSTEALVAAVRFAHPVYDALYAVLARRRGAAVLTLDQRLRRLLEKMRVDAV
jgi:predicted nucleic acid-binding protein